MRKFLGDHKENIFTHRRRKSVRDDLVKPEDLSPELKKLMDIKEETERCKFFLHNELCDIDGQLCEYQTDYSRCKEYKKAGEK